MSGAVDRPAVRSRKHRWLERILAFGGLAYWLLSAYLGLAFAAALLTTLTLSSVIRLYAELGVVVAAFGALIAHRWWPSAARLAHWAMLTLAVVMFGTCGELVELPPRYEAFDHRGVHVQRQSVPRRLAYSGALRRTPDPRDRALKCAGRAPAAGSRNCSSRDTDNRCRC